MGSARRISSASIIGRLTHPTHRWEKTITELEWLVLEWQANEGDVEFGEDDITVNFYLGQGSYDTGTIYCDLAYLPKTSANIVDRREKGILKRFENAKNKFYPWLKIKMLKKQAGT